MNGLSNSAVKITIEDVRRFWPDFRIEVGEDAVRGVVTIDGKEHDRDIKIAEFVDVRRIRGDAISFEDWATQKLLNDAYSQARKPPGFDAWVNAWNACKCSFCVAKEYKKCALYSADFGAIMGLE